MRRNLLRFGTRLRWWFYGVFGLLFASGSGWLAIHTWRGGRDEFDPRLLPLESWLLRLHGAAMIGALVLLGVLVPLHLRRGWIARRNRTAGAVVVGSFLVLITTGYALYYAGDERLREFTSLAHNATGLLFPVLLYWHVVRGRRS